MSLNTKKNDELLIEQIKKVKVTRSNLEKELFENPESDEILDKIVEINKILKNAELLVNCTVDEAAKVLSKKFPSNIDKNNKLTEKGIKRLALLNKRLDPLS